MSTDQYTPDTRSAREAYISGSTLFRETPEQHYLGAPAPDYGAEFDRFLARVRRDAQTEVLRNLPAHLSLQAHQCTAREGGGNYCALEKGHPGHHRILGVPDGWICGAVDRYIYQIEKETPDEQ